MQINITLNDDIAKLISERCQKHLQEVINEVIEENIDEVITNCLKSQLKSSTLMYLQSPELRNSMMQKIVPIVHEKVGL